MTERTLLGGRYELGEPLGSGGMAEVYRGRDGRLGRDVAVKVLRSELSGDPTFLARFRREAQAAASLNHPNIVSVYDTGDDSGVPYIVMEYVEGRTLREVLRTEGRMLPQRAMELVADICAALEYSHQAGIVHRDIKPGNVMVTSSGMVKVMDFGIARAITGATATMTQTAAVIGTAQYLSPEQARGEHVDARSDIYSTGCLLYELLTQRPPFTGDNPVAVAYQHVREDPVLPSTVNPDLDPATEAVVMKALAKNPGNRYQSAAEMREDLLRAAAGRPVRATPILDPAETTAMLTPAASTIAMPAVTDTSRSRKRKQVLGYVLLGVATLAVFAGALLFAQSLVGETGKRVAVPNVVGLTVDDARTRLAEYSLDVGDVNQQFSDKPVGEVVKQEPISRLTVTEGTEVDLWVSKGIEQVEVPNVVDLPREEAERELTRRKLKVRVVEEDVAGVPGRVRGSDPAAGAVVPVNTVVTIRVVSGRLTVPSVVGLDFVSARRELERQGFGNIRRVDVPAQDPSQVGTVVRQQPNAGEKAGRDDEIVLEVAQESSPSPSPSPSPSESPSASPSESPSASPTSSP